MTPAVRHGLRLLAVKQDLQATARMEYGVRYAEGMAPTQEFHRRHGRYSVHRVRKMAGGLRWTEAVAVYGLRPCYAAFRAPLTRAQRERIIAALHRVAVVTGGPDAMPKVKDFERLNGEGLTREDVWQLVYGGEMLRSKRDAPDVWERAADEAGLRPRRRYRRVKTRERMVSDYRECAGRQHWRQGYKPGGHGPKRLEFLRYVKYKDRDIRAVFPGGFSELVEASGFVPRKPKGGRRSTFNKAA